MGLNNQLTDFSSDSLPIFLLSVIANGVCYLRSLLFTFLHSLGAVPHQYQPFNYNNLNDTVLFDTVGSSLAGLILLSDQLNINRVFSYKYSLSTEGQDTVTSKCVVCLDGLADGDHVRKLDCRHVFHKECFDGWLDQMNFKCPLCRSPLVCDERVELTRRRLTGDVMDWFAFR